MRKRLLSLSVLFFFVMTSFVGCGKPKAATMLQPEEDGPPLLPKQEVSIKAEEGGALDLKYGDEARIKVVFPQGSLAKDESLEITQLPESGDDVLTSGFSLNRKGSTEGPSLKYPALIIFNVAKDMGKDVSIVRYNDDGTFEVIPTRVGIKDGKTSLLAQVDHFSNYGARKITPDQASDSRKKTSDFNWVIYVKDSANVDVGPMQRKITLDFKAVNTSGDLVGTYSGYARAVTNNDMEAFGGKMDADFNIQDPNVTFELSPYIELAPLVPPEDDKLAPLEPEKDPDMMGNGTLHMSGSGIATGRIGAYGGSRAVDATASSDPFTVAVIGPLVRLSVDITGVGTAFFDGYIRGEGK